MEPRLIRLLFTVLQVELADPPFYRFPNYPLEEIAAEAHQQYFDVVRRNLTDLGPGDDERKESCFQDALDAYFNESFSFPDYEKIDNYLTELDELFDSKRVSFRQIIAQLEFALRQDPNRENYYADIVILSLNLVLIQEKARGDFFLIDYGTDILNGVDRYNSLVAGGPYPREPQGRLHNTIYTLLCNLVIVLPSHFFWAGLVDDPRVDPDESYLEQRRYKYQFFLLFKLRVALAKAEFYANFTNHHCILRNGFDISEFLSNGEGYPLVRN